MSDNDAIVVLILLLWGAMSYSIVISGRLKKARKTIQQLQEKARQDHLGHI